MKLSGTGEGMKQKEAKLMGQYLGLSATPAGAKAAALQWSIVLKLMSAAVVQHSEG